MDLSGALQALPGFLQIVNVVVLLSALFFFTSTVSSHLVEVIVGWSNSRGKQLRARLEAALGKDAAKAIYNEPIIKSLSSLGRDGTLHPPSYIEPEFFAKIVAALSNKNGNPVEASPVVRDIKEKLGTAGAQLEPKIVEWFKAINDRQTGVYTRWTFLRLLAIGFAFAVFMDIDTVHIAGTLWNNPDQVEKATKALDGLEKANLTADQKKAVQEAVAKAFTEVRTIAKPNYAWQHIPQTLQEWLGKLLGWLLTALATSLGAQFWFNLMSEALKLRATGRKPDDTPKKEEKKSQVAGGNTGAGGQ